MSLDNETQTTDATGTPTGLAGEPQALDFLTPADEEAETQLALQNFEKRRKTRRRKRNIKIFVGCMLAGGILFATLGRQLLQPPEEPDEGMGIETAVVERMDFQNIINASGALKAGSTTIVVPEVDGIIESVLVKEGDKVEKGDVLFTIKNEALDKAVREAAQGVTDAERGLGQAQTELGRAVTDRDQAWGDYYVAYAEYEQDYKEWSRARKTFSKDHAAWAKKAKKVDALKVPEPVEPAAPTAPDPDAYELETTDANGNTVPGKDVKRYEADQKKYQDLNNDYQKAFAEYQKQLGLWLKYQDALAALGEEPELGEEPTPPEKVDDSSLQEAIEGARESVTSASQTLEKAREEYDDAVKEAEGRTVKAPSSGNIVALNAKVGASTLGSGGEGGGDDLAQISNMNEMAVDIEINEIDILSVEKGQKAKVTFSAVPEAECEATVVEVASVATGEGGDGGIVTFHVGLVIPKPDKRLRAGMTANVEILTADEKDVLVVPSSAVSEGADGNNVEVVLDEASLETDDPQTEYRTVTVGARNSSETVIEKGLSEGEIVVLGGGMDEGDEFEDEML